MVTDNASNALSGDVHALASSAAPGATAASYCAAMVRGMSLPDFVDDPAGEIDFWFRIVANAPKQVVQDITFWQRLPLYSQYIREKSVSEVMEDCVSHIKSCRGLNITVEEASRLDHDLGRVTILPLAVMAAFLHHGCGLPDVFAFDLFQACLASCQNTEVAVACYADKSTKFCCRARWWACPPGDPNAGKSPTCTVVGGWFRELVATCRHLFHELDNFIGVGNN